MTPDIRPKRNHQPGTMSECLRVLPDDHDLIVPAARSRAPICVDVALAVLLTIHALLLRTLVVKRV